MKENDPMFNTAMVKAFRKAPVGRPVRHTAFRCLKLFS